MSQPIRRPAPFTLVLIAILGILAAGLPAAATARATSPARSVSSSSVVWDSVAPPVRRTQPARTANDPTNVALGLSLVKSGFVDPVLVTSAGDGSGRLFVIEQAGRIRIIDGGTTLSTPFLDIRTVISSGGERGLLGMAFHPNYPTTPYVYINFTNLNGDTAINRYTVSSDPNVLTRASAYRILTIDQPYANHNGGNLAFGPDGYLYIGMGDGGSAGDPGNRAQNLSRWLGKMLRIDVDHTFATKNYRVPSSNPYVGKSGLDEVWARGFRNPWRWSFDRATGDLWIGDVGQSRYEEIDRALRTSTTLAGKAKNYGWRVLEGRACYNPPSGCSTAGKTMPLAVYGHSVTGDDNCSVTGGFVYRGAAYPVLQGVYVFGDFCSGRIWGLSRTAASPATPTLLWSSTASPHLSISSFGESDTGELFVVDRADGEIYQVTATPKA